MARQRITKYIEKLEYALDESVKLQAHYARLLNEIDGENRHQFVNRHEWMIRVEEVKQYLE